MAQQMVERIREAESRAEETIREAQRQAAQRLEEARAQVNDIYRQNEEDCGRKRHGGWKRRAGKRRLSGGRPRRKAHSNAAA